MLEFWSLLNHSPREGWFSSGLEQINWGSRMWIRQAHWCVAHTTNTHTHILNTSDTREGWATRAYDQELQRAHKLPSLLKLQLTEEISAFGCEQYVEVGIFMCVHRGYKGHGLPGSNLHSHFGQCTIKNLHITWWLASFPTPLVSWGPWHRRLIKRSPGWTPPAAWQTGHQTANTHPQHK